MTISNHASFNLHAKARQAMIDAGFAPDFPPGVADELQTLEEKQQPGPDDRAVLDLRSLMWSSIDNPDSRDLDQVEFAERRSNGDTRIMIGIADVDAFVAPGSAIDQHATQNTTSVYTGVETFPMLPEQLSTGITSLLEGVDRLTIVIDLIVDGEGAVRSSDVYRAVVHNYAKLDYESVGQWLEGHRPLPAKVASISGLEEQLRLQDEAAARLRTLRQHHGALDFETVEASPVTQNGKVIDLTVKQKNPARYLIESFMIAANTAMAAFFRDHQATAIQRVVRTPERWPRIVEIAARLGEYLPPEPNSQSLSEFLARRKAVDPEHFPDLSLSVVKLLGPGEYAVLESGATPEGHFGLAVHDYTHSTAPNRRFADLITQRLLKAVLAGKARPYAEAELAELAQHCTERENAARKVERVMRKVVAALFLSERSGEVFDAVVTGASNKGTFVRLITPPAEGRIVRGEHGLDVGDRVRVRLISTDPAQGFIDFERVS